MADKTTGGLKAVDAVSIGDLPGIMDLYDESLIPVEQQGEARHMTGRQWRQYAEAGLAYDVNAAKASAEAAAKSAAESSSAAARAEAAIQHPAIPDPVSKNWMVWDQADESYQQTSPPLRAEGQDFEIKGYYPTLAALEAAVPSPEKGYAYGIGTEPPYDIYVWDMVHSVWVNNGPMTASGDMLKSTYDPQHKNQDIFSYAESVGLPAGGTTGQIPSITSEDPRTVEWQDPPEGVGRSMAGQTVEPPQGTQVTAGDGAEVFNDYRPIEFYESGPLKAGNIATGGYSHAEGSQTTASGDNSHAEGYRTTASGDNSHAEGSQTTASGDNSHAEGRFSLASGAKSHAEGSGNAKKEYSHAEGAFTVADGDNSHAEGLLTTTSGLDSHAEGYKTTASGLSSHAEGYQTTASGSYSHAAGEGTIAAQQHQTAIGKYNLESSALSDLFIIGKGNISSNRANCFRVTNAGVYASGNYNASGADYAELFEWADGNLGHADRAGRFVTLEGKHIRLAGPGDGYILGIVSGAPSVVGDVYDDQWQGMYLTDIFGRPIMEDVEVPDVTDTFPDPENPESTVTRVVIPAHTERRQKLNPAYDNTQPYIPRSERPEWDAVGMLGKLVAVDDGTCQVNGWAAVGAGGAATASEERTRFRVMERLDESHVRILILR